MLLPKWHRRFARSCQRLNRLACTHGNFRGSRWLRAGTLPEQRSGMAQSGQQRQLRFQARGFSLIEIMIVLALVGLIMGVVVVGLRRRAIHAQIQIAQMGVRQLAEMVFQHRLANGGECPNINDWIADKTLKSEPKDPWGHVLSVVCPGRNDEGGADIVSVGPDGQIGTNDDIDSWRL